MSAAVITLVAPFLDRIEAQLDADIAQLLKHAAEQSRWEGDLLHEPLTLLLEEHARVFAWPQDKGDAGELSA